MMREGIFIAVMFISTTLRAAFGFGNALLAMPILVLLYGLSTATPVIGISAVIIAGVILIRDYEHIQTGSIRRLVVSSAAGIPLGIALLRGKFESELTCMLGIVLVSYGIFMCRMSELHSRVSLRASYIAGLIAGILGGAYNTNGPPIVIYAVLRGWNPREFRATLQAYFLVTGLLVTAGHWASGLWTARVMNLCILSLFPVSLGLVIGTILNRRFTSGTFHRYMTVILMVLGIIMIIQSIQRP